MRIILGNPFFSLQNIDLFSVIVCLAMASQLPRYRSLTSLVNSEYAWLTQACF